MADPSMPVYVQPWAEVDWQTPLTPVSRRYGDIYWSADAALAEKQHVFIAGNRLPERWAALRDAHFTVCEVGFGFGVNCLLAANAWRLAKPRGAILNYLAVEKSPVHPRDLGALLARLVPGPGLNAAAFIAHRQRLLSCYPLPSPGRHLVWLDRDICVQLVIGDVNDALPARGVDAWFLDGFQPRANPDAFAAPLLRRMAQASRAGATASTYSVAGLVRRGLETAGFSVERHAGHGAKAEMLRATVPGKWQPALIDKRSVAIVGAGLAGLHCAAALARRGIAATVFEGADAPLGGASSIPRLAVSPRLAVRPDRGSLFSLAAFQYAMQGDAVAASGLYRLASSARDQARQRRIADCFPASFCELLAPDETRRRLAMDCRLPALWFPGAGWSSPRDGFRDAANFCELHTGARIARIETDESAVRLVLAGGPSASFDRIIVATGAAPCTVTDRLPLTPARGQSIVARLSHSRLGAVIAGPLTLVPGGDDCVIAGATFDPGDTDASIRASDTEALVRQLRLLTGDRVAATGSYAGVRCTTRDRMPIAGALPDWAALQAYCRSTRRKPFTAYDARLFACTGFGAHGASHAPLCAEHLARRISGEPDGLDEGWASLLDTSRFARKGDEKQ